jgi:hypothetical protein
VSDVAFVRGAGTAHRRKTPSSWPALRTIDARIGGTYTYTMVNDATGEKMVTGCVYLDSDA